MYLRIVGSLIPRELIAKREQEPDFDYAQLTDDEIVELIEAEKRSASAVFLLPAIP